MVFLMIEKYFNSKKKATLGLTLVTLIWGLTFIWMDSAVEVAIKHNPNLSNQSLASSFVFFRFFIAAIILIPFTPNVKEAFTNIQSIKGGVWLGIIVWLGFLFQMIGIVYPDITPAVSAFLTSLYVVFTAFIGLIMGRQHLSFFMVIGVLLATFGAGWISGPPQLNFNLPEWLTVIGAFMFAAHIIATDRVTQDRNTTHLTVVMISTIALISMIILPLFILKNQDSFTDIIQLLLIPGYIIPLLFCAIFGSIIALLLLTVLQKQLSPVRAAILYALEPIWAVIFSLILGMEGEITFWLFLGGGCLIIGNLIVEIANLNKNKKLQFKPEIERRFLLEKLPPELDNNYLIEQIYLPKDSIKIDSKGISFDNFSLSNQSDISELGLTLENIENISYRVRKTTHIKKTQYIFSIKIRDAPGIRREIELNLNKDAEKFFSLQLPKIIKRRHEYKDEIGTWEIDEFLGKNQGLIIAEIELIGIEENITLPNWIGKEITDEIKYLNSNLAS
ncbi:MAG: hypothetical protein CMB56_006560 [Methanobacteriota archaeon]|nr:MAG: hypothetical protein CMB56_006560 [Euryarchaeota archaeon]|tara:strand:- start:21316 stop:22827 length:1512 start_codon:yes stop_codon:yes gene_type:complete